MADFNGLSGTTGGYPSLKYTFSYTKTRPSNTQMTYNFTIKGEFTSGNFIDNDYAIVGTMTVNGVSKEVRVKKNSNDRWNTGEIRTFNVSITCASTTANAQQNASFVTKSDGVYVLDCGAFSISGTVTSSALLYTNATPPTTFTATPNPFETSVDLSWSGAGGGTNNAIQSYEIQYTSNGGTSWGALTTVTTTSTSGSKTQTVSVNRAVSVQFRIRTRGAAGANYYSGWKYSGTIKRNSLPNNVTTFSASPTIIEGSTVISWSGGGDPDSNLESYTLEYSKDGGSNWTGITAVSSTAASGNYTWTLPGTGTIARGTALQLRIRGKDKLGQVSASWKTITGLKKNSAPVAPTAFTVSRTQYMQGENVVLSWSGAKDDDSNISKYALEYRVTTGGTWGNWTTLTSISSTSTSGTYTVTPTQASDKQQIQYRIKVVDALNVESGYTNSSAVTREDYAGIKVGVNGSWVKGYAYVGVDGAWKPAVINVGAGSSWSYGKD